MVGFGETASGGASDYTDMHPLGNRETSDISSPNAPYIINPVDTAKRPTMDSKDRDNPVAMATTPTMARNMQKRRRKSPRQKEAPEIRIDANAVARLALRQLGAMAR